MSTAALERIRGAEEDSEELSAVIAALHEKQVSTRQIADALGIADSEFGAFLTCRATELSTPTALRSGDIIVATQLAATTLIRVAQTYRRLIGQPTYSAEVIMPGSRRPRRISAALIAPWFPVKVIRLENDTARG